MITDKPFIWGIPITVGVPLFLCLCKGNYFLQFSKPFGSKLWSATECKAVFIIIWRKWVQKRCDNRF